MQDCKYKIEDNVKTDICYKCGKNGHSVTGCPDRGKIQGYPFSCCFICKQTGHVRLIVIEGLSAKSTQTDTWS